MVTKERGKEREREREKKREGKLVKVVILRSNFLRTSTIIFWKGEEGCAPPPVSPPSHKRPLQNGGRRKRRRRRRRRRRVALNLRRRKRRGRKAKKKKVKKVKDLLCASNDGDGTWLLAPVIHRERERKGGTRATDLRLFVCKLMHTRTSTGRQKERFATPHLVVRTSNFCFFFFQLSVFNLSVLVQRLGGHK